MGRRDEDGGVQEDCALDELGPHGRDLHRQPSAEAVADPVRRLVEGVEEIGHVGGDVPRLVPRRVAVAAQVDRNDVEPAREALLCELAEAEPVTGDAVKADDERRARISPFVGVQLQVRRPRSSTCVP
jgi:hypothetical protein